jgi:glycerophosphoryl diester phosphodiesterase
VAPLLSSFSFEALMAARQTAPSLPRGWLTQEFTEEDWGRLSMLEAVSLHTDHRKLARDGVARLQDKGYRVLLYTVNDIATAERLLEAGVDGLFTDNLREFARRFPEAIHVA